MKNRFSPVLALALAAALLVPAAAAPIASAPSAEKSYYVTNYGENQPFSLTFSEVVEAREPEMGKIDITVPLGTTLTCQGDYGFLCLSDTGINPVWHTYDGPGDAAFFADRDITVLPTKALRTASATNTQYADGYAWRFDQGGTYQLIAGCGFYGQPEYLRFTVKVLYDDPGAVTTAFSDVPGTAYYAAPVTWAVKERITQGTTPTTFSPAIPCTNAQVLTMMWRANGKVTGTVDYSETGIADNQYYTAAVRWAVNAGIIPNAPFDPNRPCTRAMAMDYFWKLSGKPVHAPVSHFTDVSYNSDLGEAVGWALDRGITKGTSATTFSPNDVCTRAQIVTFLYRTLEG